MALLKQLQARRAAINKPMAEIASYVAMAPSNLYRMLASNRDVKASTLEALAAAMDAEWVLVPKHLKGEVDRLLSGKSLAPDNVPSAVQRMLKDS